MNKKGDSKSASGASRNQPTKTVSSKQGALASSGSDKPGPLSKSAATTPTPVAKVSKSKTKPKAQTVKSKTGAAKAKVSAATPKASAAKKPAPAVGTKGASTASKGASTPAPGARPSASKAAQETRRKSLSSGAFVQQWRARLPVYISLMRVNRPIGILLLLWPTLWALWLAAEGWPRWDLLIIFTLGVISMRSAGCVINDFADRKIDGSVKRTRDRPLATGTVSTREVWGLFAGLCLFSLVLVLLTNKLTVWLSVGGLLLACCYPFMKRYTHLPQVVLGAAFAWSVPMAFAAQAGSLSQELWLVYLAVVLWTVVYDTFYAMVDRDDDLRIGVKSTAILFGDQDRFITGFLQALTVYTLVLVGQRFELGVIYYTSLGVASGLFIYQQYLIRYRERDACFKAFLNNNWVGLAIFIGIVLDLAVA